MQQRKVPLRKCVLCNEMYPKKELIRLVRSSQGIVELDLTGKKSGRGAYVCKQPSCLLSAKKTRRLDRALEAHIDDAVYDELAELANE